MFTSLQIIFFSFCALAIALFSGERQDPSCKDHRNDCQQRADQCEYAPGWMTRFCPVTCGFCHLQDPTVRCDHKRLNMSSNHVWNAGDLNKMAQRILGTHNDATLLLNDPYVIQFNNFIDDETIQFLIQYGNNNGFKRSTDVGPIDSFGENKQVVSNHRTSENTWCSGPCEQHHLVQRLNKRIEEITGIPQQNYESLQLLKYTRGQEYRLHHDIESDDVYSTAGARILTFFIYLNDVEGGETYFPTLDLKVKPKKGSAILWPHVLNDNVMKRDDRTYHAALPVVKGTKFAANAWVHSHDFKTPNLHGCTGAFD